MNKLPIIERADHARGFKRPGQQNKRISFYIFSVAVVFLFLVIVARLFQLTVVKGAYYNRLSDANRIREIPVEPRRGTIYDREGAVLAISTNPDTTQKGDAIHTSRTYYGGDAIGHVIGYRQVASDDDLHDDDCLTKMNSGDKTGKKGVERVYDCELRGQAGRRLIELDARGRELSTIGLVAPIAGQDLNLALDSDMQKKAYELIRKSPTQKGVAVATNPQTGEIYTMASAPGYDPQAFEDSTQSKMKTYLTSEDHPLFNRATEGAYPPGSIFKLIVATGALEDHKIDEHTMVTDNGFLKIGPATYNNWYYTEYGKTEGEVDLQKAIQRSNDIYFYTVGAKLGETRIRHWSELMGLGSRIKNLPFEQTEGVIPSPFWKQEKLGEDWYTGDTYNFSIGQGYVLASPLQMNQVASVFATGGMMCDPQLLKNAYPLCHTIKMSPSTMSQIRAGMRKACETGGTGWPMFNFAVGGRAIPVGCKTGTAESHGAGEPAPHAWFTVFAPYDHPTIQVTVMIENGGQGSDAAAPIAKELLSMYFAKTK